MVQTETFGPTPGSISLVEFHISHFALRSWRQLSTKSTILRGIYKSGSNYPKNILDPYIISHDRLLAIYTYQLIEIRDIHSYPCCIPWSKGGLQPHSLRDRSRSQRSQISTWIAVICLSFGRSFCWSCDRSNMRNDNNNIKTSLETQTCKKACNQLINLMYPSSISIISNHFQPAGPGGAHVPGGSFCTHEISCEGESHPYESVAHEIHRYKRIYQ